MSLTTEPKEPKTVAVGEKSRLEIDRESLERSIKEAMAKDKEGGCGSHAQNNSGNLNDPDHSPCGDSLSDCSKEADQPPVGEGFWSQLLNNGLYNAFDLSFDEVYQEPKTILMLGGCRHREFARYIALLLPSAEISLYDTDAAIAMKAKEEVCCRFQFFTGSATELPYEDKAFDLVIAHNLFEMTDESNWQQALNEAHRISNRNLMVSHHRPMMWNLLKLIPGVKHAIEQSGVTIPETTLPKPSAIKKHLHGFSSLNQTTLTPLPWRLHTLLLSKA